MPIQKMASALHMDIERFMGRLPEFMQLRYDVISSHWTQASFSSLSVSLDPVYFAI